MEVLYNSTRSKGISKRASQAILQGLAEDGGLFVPDRIPALDRSLEELAQMDYRETAYEVMKLFLTDFTEGELRGCIEKAYDGKFDTERIAPLREAGGAYYLELFHGPTIAFKDMALSILPHLMIAAARKNHVKNEIVILTATSGDTGKGALEGFKDVDRTKILVFYPKDGVSDIQQLQMNTQEGQNVGVCSVVGNFDDAQTGVKTLFSDEELRRQLAQRGYFLSSANSINWGRVLPQIVYYVSAYCDLLKKGAIEEGGKINVCVPTGNFGNILAAYYAKCMGVPVDKLICASNRNNVLTDFLRTGVYDRNRTFFNTTSPSMDILISSNLERLLFTISGQDDKAVRGYMAALQADGRYEVDAELQAAIKKNFAAGCCDDEATMQTIEKVFREKDYLIDTHTAVAFHVLEQYRAETGDQTPTVVVSTASPFKFCNSVLHALGEEQLASGTDILKQLTERTGIPAPGPLAALAGKAVRFERCVEKDDMLSEVQRFLQ